MQGHQAQPIDALRETRSMDAGHGHRQEDLGRAGAEAAGGVAEQDTGRLTGRCRFGTEAAEPDQQIGLAVVEQSLAGVALQILPG